MYFIVDHQKCGACGGYHDLAMSEPSSMSGKYEYVCPETNTTTTGRPNKGYEERTQLNNALSQGELADWLARRGLLRWILRVFVQILKSTRNPQRACFPFRSQAVVT